MAFALALQQQQTKRMNHAEWQEFNF